MSQYSLFGTLSAVSICLFQLAVVASAEAAHPTGIDGVEAPKDEILKSLRTLSNQNVQDTTIAATLTLEEISRGILAWHDGLRSLAIEFNYEFKDDLTDNAATTVLQKFAFKGVKRYASHGTESRPRIHVTDGINTKRYLGGLATSGKVWAGDDVLGIETQLSTYYFLRSLMAHADGEGKENWEHLPSQLLRPGFFFSILPDLEMVDGHLCHVVTSAMNTYWIDHQFGFCVRRHVVIGQTSHDDPGCLLLLATYKEFAEVEKGVWLPESARRMLYTGQTEPKTRRGKLKQIQTSAVISLEANSVADSLFDVPFPPGTRVRDYINGSYYIVPQGEELLDKAIAEGLPIVDGKIIDSKFKPWQIWLVVVNAFALAIVGFFLVMRSRRVHQP